MPAFADEPVLAVPHPWQIGMQAPGSPVAEKLQSLNDFVLHRHHRHQLFVAALLAWVVYRYNEKRNPVASSVSHNSMLEAAWTAIPVLILVSISFPACGWCITRTARTTPT